jgi:hypothetical protein
MTNEQIWQIACQQTLIEVAKSLLNIPDEDKSIFPDDNKDLIVAATYAKIGQKVMSMSIPKIPKELK